MRTPQLRGLSPSTLDLVKKLYGRRALFQRWNRADDTIAILEQISEANEPAAIRDLMPFGLARSEEIRAKARTIILRLFAQVPIETLPSLDESLRQSWANLEDWYGLRPEAIDSLGQNTDADRTFLGLVTSHRNGYVRAAALRALEADSSDIVIPFVLIRLVDWVSEVRFAAERAVQEKLRPEYARAFVGCLGLIDRLTTNSRFRAVYTHWLDALLTRAECAGTLREGMAVLSRGIRRHCYRVAVENPALTVDDVIEQAIGDPDVIVRKWAYTASRSLLPASEEALRLRAAEDPYGPIRRIAFDAFAANPSARPEDVMPFLFDRSAAIRRDCQTEISNRIGKSAAEFYRTRIQNHSSKNADISVLGLAETGTRDDAVMIAALLGSRSARVRRAVVRALRILAANGYEATLLRVVSSDVPSVAREAAFALLCSRAVPADGVWAEAKKNGDRRVRSGVLKLLKNAGKWQQLQFFLEASADSDLNLSELAIGMLSAWMQNSNSSFVQPSTTDTEMSLRPLESVRRCLPAPLVHQLEFILQTAAK
jgi:HEAT repeat protein